MKQRTSVDIMASYKKEVKDWYLKYIDSFYLISDKEGRIVYYSEASIDLFGLNLPDKNRKDDLGALIGNANKAHLRDRLITDSAGEDIISLPESFLSGKYWDVRPKVFDHGGQNNFFLFFRLREDHSRPAGTDICGCYEEALDILNIPIVMIKDDDFIYKNRCFEDLIKKEGIDSYSSLKSWIKSYLKVNNYSIEDREFNFGIRIIKGDIKYTIAIEYLRNLKDVVLMTLIKQEVAPGDEDVKDVEEVVADNTAEIINEIEIVRPEGQNVFIADLKKIKKDIEAISLMLNDSDNDPSAFLKRINERSGLYEDIINYTGKSLLSMSENASFIDDVSVKIHLISINAAIESARSGESGKGFAVISKEIAKLSEATKDYTGLIGHQINSTKDYMDKIKEIEKGGGADAAILIDKIIKNRRNIKEALERLNEEVLNVLKKLNE